jgi:2-amino-4-hydroxy-6-hydroxymethyldihydropteridine diphosphokinase
MPSKIAYLSLGSNLGNREENIERALAALEKKQIRIIKRSSLYETEPQDVADQPWFLNMAAACETPCFPLHLLGLVMRAERQLGRVRSGATPRGPRSIDIDILLYGSMQMETPQLTIPHPRMLERRFVLEPLLEIAPDLRYPTTGQPLKKYLSGLLDQKVALKR